MTISEYIKPVKRQVLLWSLLLPFLLLPRMLFSHIPPDSLAGVYPLNDPRNPQCPCHQYQRLADEEYRQLLANTGKDGKTGGFMVSGNAAVSAGKVNAETGSGKKHKGFWHRKVLRNRRLQFSGFGKVKRHRSYIRRFKRIDDCFRF